VLSKHYDELRISNYSFFVPLYSDAIYVLMNYLKNKLFTKIQKSSCIKLNHRLFFFFLATKSTKQFWKSFKSELGNKNSQALNNRDSRVSKIAVCQHADRFAKVCSPKFTRWFLMLKRNLCKKKFFLSTF